MSVLITRVISKHVLTFVRLKYVHCVSDLQRQLLLSSGIVVIDCWRKMGEDNIRGDITGEEKKEKKAIKLCAPLWR